ncbi:MAG: type II toxin-antitoxin system HicA family toxin [Chitinophagaceae bacterium]
MSKLPIINAHQFEKILFRIGFEIIRQKGSHRFYKHPDGRYTTLPHHKGEDLSRPIIREILKQVEISNEEFILLLK